MILWAKFMKKYTNFMVKPWNSVENILEKNKKVVIIFGHPLCIPCQKVMLYLPIVMFKVWKKWYKLKFCNVKENCELCKEIWLKKTPVLHIYENGVLKQQIEDDSEIMNFLWI